MRTFLKVVAIILLLYLGLGAIYGGLTFISDPSGGGFRMSVEYLENSPFRNYLIPGIILLLANGLFPLLIIALILLRKKIYNWLLIIQGCLLTGWLTVELIINRNFFMPVFHYPLYITGLLLAVTGFMLMKTERKAKHINHII